jgi:hypothetical protein
MQTHHPVPDRPSVATASPRQAGLAGLTTIGGATVLRPASAGQTTREARPDGSHRFEVRRGPIQTEEIVLTRARVTPLGVRLAGVSTVRQ